MIIQFDRIFNDSELQIALIALVTSIISILIGFSSLIFQIIHNKKSVRPIGTINLANYINFIAVRISNNGVGPMIIKSCNTKGPNGNEPYPINWMPDEICWHSFRTELENHAIVPGESLVLLEKKIDINLDSEVKQLQLIKTILKDLEMTIEYSDIYNKKFKISRKFNWFDQ